MVAGQSASTAGASGAEERPTTAVRLRIGTLPIVIDPTTGDGSDPHAIRLEGFELVARFAPGGRGPSIEITRGTVQLSPEACATAIRAAVVAALSTDERRADARRTLSGLKQLAVSPSVVDAVARGEVRVQAEFRDGQVRVKARTPGFGATAVLHLGASADGRLSIKLSSISIDRLRNPLATLLGKVADPFVDLERLVVGAVGSMLNAQEAARKLPAGSIVRSTGNGLAIDLRALVDGPASPVVLAARVDSISVVPDSIVLGLAPGP